MAEVPTDATTAHSPEASASVGPPDSAGVRIQPILIYALFMVAGVALDRLLPLPFPPARLRVMPGWILLAAGIVFIAWTLLEFLAARVSPETTRPARALIVGGPFRVSRNPIYLGGLLLCLGGGLLAGSAWMVVMTVPLAILTDRAVVRREEAYLGRRFGAEYRAYAARVRRWI